MVIHANGIDEEAMAGYRRLFEEHEGSFISYGAYLLEAPVKRGFAGRCMEILLANVKRVLVKLRG